MCHIHLAIADTHSVPSARGFYDTIEDTLNVVIRTRGKFFSYIQGEKYSIDLDKKGKILGMEIFAPKKEWTVKTDLLAPTKFEPKKILIKEHRREFEPLGYFTNDSGNFCCMRFTSENISYFYKVAQNLIFEVNVMDELSAVWVLNLIEDYGFKKEMQYRKGLSV